MRNSGKTGILNGMKKFTEIVSFLFLSSLVFFSGLFFITIHVALSQSTPNDGTTCPTGYVWDATSNSCKVDCSSMHTDATCNSRSECMWELTSNSCKPRSTTNTNAPLTPPPPPVRSNGAPSGVLPPGVLQTAVTLSTDKQSLCKFSTAPGTIFSQMPGQFEHSADGLHHTYLLASLTSGSQITLYVRCHASDASENNDDYLISFSAAPLPTNTNTNTGTNTNTAGNTNTNTNSSDNTNSNGNTNTNTPGTPPPPAGTNTSAPTPPALSNPTPNNVTLPATATQALVNITTDRAAQCKFSRTPGVPYAQMTETLGRSSDAMHHFMTYINLHPGDVAKLFIRCHTTDNGENNEDYVLSFKVALAGTEPTNTSTTPPPGSTPPPNPTNTSNTPPQPAGTNTNTPPPIAPTPREVKTLTPPPPATNTEPRPFPATQQTSTNPAPRPTPAPWTPTTSTGLPTPAQTQAQESDAIQHCKDLGILDPAQCRLFLTYNLDPDCVSEHMLTPQACEEYLKVKKVASLCADKNIAPGADCADTVFETYKPQVHCGDLNEDECASITKERFLGQIVNDTARLKAFSDTIAALPDPIRRSEEMKKALDDKNLPRDLFPLTEDEKGIQLLESTSTIDVSNKVTVDITAPLAITLDDDNDGLSNDLERLYGTNPENHDTDGDTFSDLDEIKNGYDPLKPGGEKIDRHFSATEQALVDHVSIEQPTTAGDLNPQFKIDSVNSAQGSAGYNITGSAEPNSIVLIYVYSKMPLVLTVKTDASGNFVYSLQDSILDGKHSVYVAVTNETGKIKEKSNPLTFFVSQARAETPNDFLREQIISTKDTKRESFMTFYIIAGASLALFGLAGFLIYLYRKNASY